MKKNVHLRPANFQSGNGSTCLGIKNKRSHMDKNVLFWSGLMSENENIQLKLSNCILCISLHSRENFCYVNMVLYHCNKIDFYDIKAPSCGILDTGRLEHKPGLGRIKKMVSQKLIID